MTLEGHCLAECAVTGSAAKPAVLAHTMDGAQLTNVLGHVTASVKIVDPRAKDPLTGVPLVAQGLFQSRNLCFPSQITFGGDCKDLCTCCFGNFLECFNAGLTVPGGFGLPELSNFLLTSPQDLSSLWKTVGLGGGSFSACHFCHVCMCLNGDIALWKEGSKRCGRCSRLDIDTK